MLAWLLLWSLSFSLMMLYAGKIAPDEALFAALGSAISASASKMVLEKRLAPLRGEWRCAAQIWRLPRYLVSGTWEVLAVLARQIFLRKPAPSLLYGVRFDAGGDDDASALRRALAIAYTTATPNFVVVGIDRPRGLLVYHQVEKGPIPEMTVQLGAKP
ncbi:MAG TPA: hypothetical protein VI356_23365 [Myxococcales bacterium]|nr:hypothetical protein [Myxococcales bacterium]